MQAKLFPQRTLMTSKASASSLATRMLWRLACTRTAIRYREKCATKDSQEIPVATNALMQIKEAGWSVGFGSPTRPHSPTKWQRRTGTALCTWWQTLTTKPMGTNCENICACHQLRVLRSWLVDSVASTMIRRRNFEGPPSGVWLDTLIKAVRAVAHTFLLHDMTSIPEVFDGTPKHPR